MYLQWNDSIARHFFRPEMAGRTVYLYVTEELLDKLGEEWGATHRDFVTAAKHGPPWVTRDGLCQKALQALDNWRARRRVYPPYVGYLALFVLAAGLEGDFAPHAYYPRLRQLLTDTKRDGMLPSYERMWELWEDLEEWANQDMSGELGVFTSQIAGSWVHVGLPTAQTVMTEWERKLLPRFFVRAGLDANVPPSDAELARLLRRHVASDLRSRLRRLLHSPEGNREFLSALLEAVREELSGWDGTVDPLLDSPGEGPESAPQVYGSLRLSLAVDRPARRAAVTARCSTRRDLPEDGLLLRCPGDLQQYFCEQILPHWSSTLIASESGSPMNAAELDWLAGTQFVASTPGWRFRLPGGPLRIFRLGKQLGLPGYVEVQQIQREIPFALLVHEQAANTVIDWGQSSCKDFSELAVQDGLPSGWRLFTSAGALTDEGIRDTFPILAFSESIRLTLENGIRISRGTRFFEFGPPLVVLEGGDGSERVFCRDTELVPIAETRTYELPPDLPVDTRIVVEVRRVQEPLRRRSFYLESGINWRRSAPEVLFDDFCEPVPEELHPDGPGIAGAYSVALVTPELALTFPDQILGFDNVYLLGPSPGQVVEWHGEDLPADWSPVWAIHMQRKKGEAIFCGVAMDGPKKHLDPSAAPREVRQWKELLWYRRKRIEAPRHPALNALWKKYRDFAKSVRI